MVADEELVAPPRGFRPCFDERSAGGRVDLTPETRSSLVEGRVTAILDRHASKHVGVGVGVYGQGETWTFARGRVGAVRSEPPGPATGTSEPGRVVERSEAQRVDSLPLRGSRAGGSTQGQQAGSNSCERVGADLVQACGFSRSPDRARFRRRTLLIRGSQVRILPGASPCSAGFPAWKARDTHT